MAEVAIRRRTTESSALARAARIRSLALKRRVFSPADPGRGHRRSADPRGGHPVVDRRIAARPSEVRLWLLRQSGLEPRHQEVRRARADLRNACHLSHRYADRGAARPRHRRLPDRALPAAAAAPDRHRDRAFRGDTKHHLRHLGRLFIFAPFMQSYIQPSSSRRSASARARLSLRRAAFGIGVLTAGLVLAIMVLPFITAVSRDVFDTVPPMLKEVRLRDWLHDLGGRQEHRHSLYAGRRHRRRDAGARPRARRDDGGDLRHRQRHKIQSSCSPRARPSRR